MSRSAIEDAARIRSVAPHLRGQRLERRKARLVAQLRRELDFNLATVQLAAKIEQVRRQQGSGRLAVASEAKVVTDYHDPRVQLARQELRKGFTREVTQCLAEAQQPQIMQAGAREDPPALAERSEPRGRIIPRQVLAR